MYNVYTELGEEGGAEAKAQLIKLSIVYGLWESDRESESEWEREREGEEGGVGDERRSPRHYLFI